MCVRVECVCVMCECISFYVLDYYGEMRKKFKSEVLTREKEYKIYECSKTCVCLKGVKVECVIYVCLCT